MGNNGVEKQGYEGLTRSTEIQKFFGKVLLKLLGSDLGNVGSEKLASRTHSLVGTSIGCGGGSIGKIQVLLSCTYYGVWKVRKILRRFKMYMYSKFEVSAHVMS